jgi:hypothetical protein
LYTRVTPHRVLRGGACVAPWGWVCVPRPAPTQGTCASLIRSVVGSCLLRQEGIGPPVLVVDGALLVTRTYCAPQTSVPAPCHSAVYVCTYVGVCFPWEPLCGVTSFVWMRAAGRKQRHQTHLACHSVRECSFCSLRLGPSPTGGGGGHPGGGFHVQLSPSDADSICPCGCCCAGRHASTWATQRVAVPATRVQVLQTV